MKKEIKLIALLIILGVTSLVAQNRALQRQTEIFVYNADVYDTRSFYNEEEPQKYDGTPYYNVAFLPGEIYLENELLDNNVLLRYNAVADEIEYKDPKDEDNLKALVKTKGLYVTINQDTFVFIPSKGYFIAIQDGTNFSLLKKVAKKYYPPKEAKNTYDKGSIAKFTDKHSFYIYSKEGVLNELAKSKKKRLKAFGNSEEIVKKYIKENSLDINQEKDLKRIVLYLDGVENAKL